MSSARWFCEKQPSGEDEENHDSDECEKHNYGSEFCGPKKAWSTTLKLSRSRSRVKAVRSSAMF